MIKIGNYKLLQYTSDYSVVILCSQLQGTYGDFATRLFLSVTTNETKKNLAIAPLVIQESLVLLYLGSDGEGSRELKKSLNLNGASKNEAEENYKNIHLCVGTTAVTLQTAFKFFVDKMFPLRPKFRSDAKHYLFSNVDSINLKEADYSAFNMESRMNHQFEEVINKTDINANTRSILVQAFYFEGNLKKPFKQLMRKRMFFIKPGTSILVVTYIQVDRVPYADLTHLKCHGIEIPYQESILSLIILLPYKGSNLRALETQLANTDVESITDNFEETDLHIEIPHFSINTVKPLIGSLKRMGIKKIFDHPEFDSLTDTPFFKVSRIKHMGQLEFDCGADECMETTIASVTGDGK